MTPADSRAQRKEFDRLLFALDRDRNRAGEAYEKLRERLATLFSCNGFPEAYDLVDETFRRIERKLDEDLRIESIAAYAAGIAKYICKETEKEGRKLEDVDVDGLTGIQVREPDAEEQRALELASTCLERCLKTLPERDQRLILGYYSYAEDKKAPSEEKKASSRRRLADSLGISYAALRVTAHRLRTDKIEPCVRDCLNRGAAE